MREVAGKANEIADGTMILERVTQCYGSIDVIPRAATDSAPSDCTTCLEIRKNLEHRTLRDPDKLRKIAYPCVGLPRDGDEHMGVIA